MFGGCSLSIYLYDYYCLLCFISTGKKQHQSPYSLNRFPYYYHWCISSPAMIGFGDPRPIQLLKMVIQVVDLPMKNGDFPQQTVSFPEGKLPFSYGFPIKTSIFLWIQDPGASRNFLVRAARGDIADTSSPWLAT